MVHFGGQPTLGALERRFVSPEFLTDAVGVEIWEG